MAYRVVVSETARRAISRLHPTIADTVQAKIVALGENPRPQQAIPLRGERRGRWRLRVADYRVIYVIDDQAHFVNVEDVRHRREAYE